MPRFINLRYLLKSQGSLLALILLISLTFLFQAILGRAFYFDFMAIPAEVTLAWQTLLAKEFSEVRWGEFGTLFSAVLLHGDLGHLSGNMLFLWVFAALTAELLGQRWMLFTFVFTGIAGSICHVAMDPGSPIPSLGASGAVSGFTGIYLAMAVRWRLPDPHVWPLARPVSPASLAGLAIVFVALDFYGKTSGDLGTAYGAHFGGFVAGLILGSFAVKMPRVALPR
jgi:membrane associated rhomboid family serine protease